MVLQDYLRKINPAARFKSNVCIIIYALFLGVDCHKLDFI